MINIKLKSHTEVNSDNRRNFQELLLTFHIEGIALGDVILGMHLFDFFKKGQEDREYSSKMLLTPDIERIRGYIKSNWSETKEEKILEIMNYIQSGIETFQGNIEKVEKLSLQVEESSAFQLAQKQMRNFIPIIFPIAFEFKINLNSHIEMYESASTPALKLATDLMANEIIREFPEMKNIFKKDNRAKKKPSETIINWFSQKFEPGLKSDNFEEKSEEEYSGSGSNKAGFQTEFPVFAINYQENRIEEREVVPQFTGNFYFPSILKKMGLEERALELMRKWIEISQGISPILATVLAPGGAMIKYKKRRDA